MIKQSVIFQDLGVMDYKSTWDYQEMLLQGNVRVKSEIRRRESESAGQRSELINQQPQIAVPAEISKYEISGARRTLSTAQEGLQIEESQLTHNSPLTTDNYLLFVEHPPVVTLGKNGNMNHVLLSEERLRERGIEFFRTNRGGDITFHGPQQIVAYPILDLEKFDTDIGHYLRNLEEVVILTLSEYGIEAGRSKGETGVWIDPETKGRERKICAIGVRCSRWITMHGFAFNVNTDLNYFNFIIPCGIQNKQVTSLKKELGRGVDMEEAKEKVRRNFEKVFNVHLVSPHQEPLEP